MGKKKFIDKNNSQKFHLLHRSLLDEAHAKEGVPSEYVLVAAGQIAETRERPSAPLSEVLKSRRDHVNELGFVNDGYDYNQHLREGGGRFMGRDGHFYDAPRVPLSLPEEALPSEGALRRDFEAITISEEVMDEDLRAALFDDADEEGDFEELDDDFVEQVMKEPEMPDFDFDAHIAALIARSEQQLVSTNKARGWDDADAKKLKKIRNKKSIRFDELDSDGELIEEDDDDESGYFDSDFENEGEDDDGAVPDSVKEERQAALEAQLDEALAEYDDAHIGDLQEILEEEDEEETGGVDFEDDALNQALDEFLQDQKDSVLAYGTHVRKGARNVLLLKKNEQNEYVHEELHPVADGPVDFKKECEEQNKLQEEWKEKVQELEEESKEIEKDLETCQEYLREVKVTEEWDCETIISTYSTLDNHPTVIRDSKSKFKPYKSKFLREQEAQAAVLYSDTGSLASHNSRKSKSSTSTPTQPLTGKIVLAGKLNLPMGFGPATNAKPKVNRHLSAIPENKVNDSEDDDESDEEDRDEEENEGEESENRSEQQQRPEGWVERDRKGKKRETAEEKKARKQAVKEERKTKRASKKQLKNMFKQEGSTFIRSVGSEQTINHVSVFKYST